MIDVTAVTTRHGAPHVRGRLTVTDVTPPYRGVTSVTLRDPASPTMEPCQALGKGEGDRADPRDALPACPALAELGLVPVDASTPSRPRWVARCSVSGLPGHSAPSLDALEAWALEHTEGHTDRSLAENTVMERLVHPTGRPQHHRRRGEPKPTVRDGGHSAAPAYFRTPTHRRARVEVRETRLTKVDAG